MSEATKDREQAARFDDKDVLGILYEHHATVHELVDEIKESSGEDRRIAFDRLKTILTAHETAEENVIRPVTRETAGPEIAEARIAEEQEADEVAARLSELDINSSDFENLFEQFAQSVSEHAEAEENEEFPTLEQERDEQQRRELGSKFLTEFTAAGGST